MTTQTQQPPVLSLAAPTSEVVTALASACKQWGFFQVINHGIPVELLQATLAASNSFFKLPLADKQALNRTREQPWGYYDRELTKNLRDRKEIFDVGHEGDVPWPGNLPTFEPVIREFNDAAHALAIKLSAMIAQALGLPTQAALALNSHHGSFTRLNHYPLHDLLADSDAPPAGPLGISRHTDAGVLTVLLQDAVSGLQMQHQGQWVDVPARPDTLTINLGDMFQVWANDSVSAPVHRVLASSAAARFSVAYFLNPGENSVIAPLTTPNCNAAAHYNAIHWAQFRGLRALGDYGDYGEEVQISHYRCD